MRGRKPLVLRIVPHDAPILQQIARSRSLPWYQIQRAKIVLGVAAGEPIHDLAVQHSVRPLDDLENLPPLPGLGTARPPGPTTPNPGGLPGFPPPTTGQIVDWPAWNRSPRGCTSLTGPARTWPVKPSLTGSPRPSVTGRSADPRRGGPAAAPHSLLEDRPAGRRVQGAGREGPLVLWQRRAAGPQGLLGGLRR